jgi:hypothetical protein|nr:DUF3810 family protein [Clostridium beijerinckii]
MENLLKRKKNISIKTKFITSGLLLGFSILLFAMARYIYGFSNFYYKYIYSILVNTLSRCLSLIPFSVYEIILYAFLIYILVRIVNYTYLLFSKQLSLKKNNNQSNFKCAYIYISICIFKYNDSRDKLIQIKFC